MCILMSFGFLIPAVNSRSDAVAIIELSHTADTMDGCYMEGQSWESHLPLIVSKKITWGESG